MNIKTICAVSVAVLALGACGSSTDAASKASDAASAVASAVASATATADVSAAEACADIKNALDDGTPKANGEVEFATQLLKGEVPADMVRPLVELYNKINASQLDEAGLRQAAVDTIGPVCSAAGVTL